MNANAGKILVTDSTLDIPSDSVSVLKGKDYALYKVDADGAGKSPVVGRVGDVAPVVRKSPLDIVVHASARAEHAETPPPDFVVERVRVGHCGIITGLQDYG